jgi:hypothetical protein
MALPGTDASPNTVIAEMLRMQRRFIYVPPPDNSKGAARCKGCIVRGFELSKKLHLSLYARKGLER